MSTEIKIDRCPCGHAVQEHGLGKCGICNCDLTIHDFQADDLIKVASSPVGDEYWERVDRAMDDYKYQEFVGSL